MVYSGMGPDYRVLIKRARKAAHEYKLYYGADIPTSQLVIFYFDYTMVTIQNRIPRDFSLIQRQM
jgi:20S proteasome alpha/beta subunit